MKGSQGLEKNARLMEREMNRVQATIPDTIVRLDNHRFDYRSSAYVKAPNLGLHIVLTYFSHSLSHWATTASLL